MNKTATVDFFPKNLIKVPLSYGDIKVQCHIINKFYEVNETGTGEKAYIILCVKVYTISYYFYNYFIRL